MMKKMKKKTRLLVIGFALLLIALIAIPTSYAYFTAKDEANKQYTFAVIDTEIDEPKPEVQPTYIIKKPSVKNNGDVGCMIRVRLTASPEELFTNGALALDVNTKDWEKRGDYYYYKQIVEPGKSTSSVINGIYLQDKSKITKDFDVAVAEESVQYKLSNQEEYLNAKQEDGSINMDTAAKIWQIYENKK